MGFDLSHIFKEIYQIYSVPKFSIGFYKEKKSWSLIKPLGNKWGIKEKRPFIVVHTTEKYIYFILLTTSNFHFPCYKDRVYGITYNTPKVNIKDCNIDNAECLWIREDGKIFKRKINDDCAIVLRIGKKYFEEFFYTCGKCKESVIPEDLKIIVDQELKGWGIEIS